MFNNLLSYDGRKNLGIKGRIMKLTVFPVNGQNDVYIRPYTVSSKTTHDQEVNFEISNNHIGAANIENGWSERRNVFVLFYQTQLTPDSWDISIIQGYTNYDGISKNGLLDDSINYEFHINSIKSLVYTNKFGKTLFKLNTNSNLLVNNNLLNNDFASLKPTDIIGNLYNISSNEYFIDDNTFINYKMGPKTRYNGYTMNSRDNNLSNDYNNKLAKALEHEVISLQTRPMTINTSYSWEKMLSDVEIKEKSLIASNIFSHDLFTIRNNENLNVFTLQDLKDIDPNVVNVIETSNNSMEISNVHEFNTLNFCNTNYGLNSKIAQELALAVQSICQTKALLDKCSLIISSHNEYGMYEPTCYITDAGTLSTYDENYFATLLDIVEKYIKNILIASISNNGLMKIDATIEYRLTTTTKILLSIEGNIPEPFCFPSYADGLYSPVVGNTDILNQLSNEVNDVFEDKLNNIYIDEYF